MKKRFISATILAILLSGCSTFNDMGHKNNEFTGEYERNDFSEGAAVGAAVAAAVAVATGGGSAVIYSALVGTNFFSWVGMENDLDANKTLIELRKQGIIVENSYDTITISFAEDITFDLQKTDLKEQFLPVLRGVSLVLNELDGNATFKVVGHADYTGPKKLNNYLSNERATVVTENLIKMGVNPSNFTDITGVNSSSPKDYCIELSCLRRVEILIHKNDILYKI